MNLFAKKYLKFPLVALAVFCLLFQFFPAPQPVQAGVGDTIAKFINRIFKKIKVPNELELTNEGSIQAGSLLNVDCLFKTSADKIPDFCGCNISFKCGWRERGKNCDDLSEPLESKECVHPFSQLDLGFNSQTEEITKEGYLAMPIPNVPEICELKIPLPKGDTTDSPEEKMALRKACNYFRSIQQEAAQQVYLTKKIYNNTDPFSKCFFLRNCRSSCSLRFGEIKYTITLMDVAKLFLPTGFLSIVQKIVNLVKIFQEVKDLWDMFKSILNDGVGVINTLLGVVQNVANFVSAFQNLGLKMSDVFMFNPITMVLTGETPVDRISKGYEGFIKMIDDFSNNLLNFSSAKAEALKTSEASKKDISAVVEGGDLKGFKYEPEIGFLFTDSSNQKTPQNYENKKRLDKILSDYQVIFRDARSIIDQLSLIGIVLGTDPVVRRITAENKPECDNICALECDCRDECFRGDDPRCKECAGQSTCTPDCLQSCITEDVLLPADVQVQSTAWQNIEGILENCCGPGPQADPEQPFCRDRADQMEYVCNLGAQCDPDTGICIFVDTTQKNCADTDTICLFPERVLSKNGFYSYTPGADLITPAYIEEVIGNALYRTEGGLQHYLTHKKTAWKEYWQQLARICQGNDWVENELREKDETKRHLGMLGACTEYSLEEGGGARIDWTYSLQIIRDLDSDFKDSIGASKVDFCPDEKECQDTEKVVKQKIQPYTDNYYNTTQDLKFQLKSVAGTGPWFNTFRAIFLDLNRFQQWFALINPDYIEEVIDKALGEFTDGSGADVYSMKILDYTKEAWRNYWEDLGRELVSWQYVADLISKNDDLEEVHELIMKRCVDTISSLQIISDLEYYSENKKFEDYPGRYKEAQECFEGENITPGCVKGQVNNAYAEYKATTGLYRANVFVEMDKIQENINKISQQREDLAGQYAKYDQWKIKPNKYWETAAWCDSDCEVKKLSFFDKSYEPDLIDVDTGEWDERIEALNNANSSAPNTESGLKIIEDVLSAGISPDDSLLVYYLAGEAASSQGNFSKLGAEFDGIFREVEQKKEDYCNPKSSAYSTYNYYSAQFDLYYGFCDTCLDDCKEDCRADCDDCEECNKDDCKEGCDIGECRSGCDSARDDICYGGCNDEPEGSCWKKGHYQELAINEWARLQALCQDYERFVGYLGATPKKDEINGFCSTIAGNLGSLAIKVQDLEKIWEAEMPAANTESEAAINYVQRIVDTIDTASAAVSLVNGISNTTGQLNGALDEIKPYLDQGIKVIAPATTSQITKEIWDKFLLRDGDYPSGVILRLKDALKVVKEKIVDLLIERMGNDYTCEKIGEPPTIVPGFLHEIRCFENDNIDCNFSDIQQYFLPILKKFEDLIIQIDAIRKGVLDLKPLIRLELFQMDEEKAVDEIFNTISGGAFGSWAKENKSKVYSGDKPLKTFKDLKQLFDSNPLLFIAGIFEELQVLLAGVDISLDQIKSEVGYGQVFGSDARGLAYQTAIENIKTNDTSDLQNLIFGKGETGLACNHLSLLLSATSSEIQQGCEEMEASSTVQTILKDTILQDDCPLLMEVFVGDLEKSIENLEKSKADVDSEIADLNRKRLDVGETHLKCPADVSEPGMWPPPGIPLNCPPQCPKEGCVPPSCPPSCPQGCPPIIGGYESILYEGYEEEKLFCLESQIRLQELSKIQAIQGDTQGNPGRTWAKSGAAIKDFQASCQDFDIYQSLTKECSYFKMLGYMFQNKCNQLAICSSEEKDLCKQGKATYVCQECCLAIRDRVESSFCNNKPLNCAAGIPDLTNEGQAAELEKIREICEDNTVDIKSSLDGVMKVFSILIGIKSGTGIYNGVKTFFTDGQALIQQAKKFIWQFRTAPARLALIWENTYETTADTSSGFSMPSKVKCMAHPAVSYQGSKELTSVAGGPVCPNVDNYFKGLDAQFALIRQNLRQIDLTRRAVQKQYWDIGSLRIIPYDKYPVMYEAVNPVYDIAELLKKKSQYLWALATAVNFANQSCTCGNSWCKMPLCISGLPLTLDPVKNPYCHLTWILRYPMEKLAEGLAEDLEAEY